MTLFNTSGEKENEDEAKNGTILVVIDLGTMLYNQNSKYFSMPPKYLNFYLFNNTLLVVRPHKEFCFLFESVFPEMMVFLIIGSNEPTYVSEEFSKVQMLFSFKRRVFYLG